MRSHHSQHYYLILGFGLGLALPPLVRRLKKRRRRLGESSGTTSTTDGPSPSPSAGSTGAKTEGGSGSGSGNSTNAVRTGLSSSGTGALRIPPPILKDFVSDILRGAGVTSRTDSDLVASVLLYADARGIPSHGANRTDTYANEIESGLVNGSAVPIVEKSSGCTAVVDGRNGLGAVTSSLAVQTAISLARTHGVGFVVCRNSNHFGAAGYWSREALNVGMIGMSFTNTSPNAVPTGGTTRAVGTNPFCFFAPAAKSSSSEEEAGGSGDGDGDGDSFQLDMATSVVPIGKIEVMDRLSKPVPPGWGVDRNGEGCTDAEEICRRGGLCPLGGSEETAGYKGYGLGVFVEIVTAVLSGSAVGTDVQPWLASRDGPIDYGHCFVVIDPARFAPGFGDRLGRYLRSLRSLPGNVRVAGDPEREFERDAEENGIVLHGPVAASLKGLAERYGVEVPTAFRDLDSSKAKKSLYA